MSPYPTRVGIQSVSVSRRRVTCVNCERHIDECGPLSARGRCADCGEARLRANIDAMILHSGETKAAWREGMLRAALDGVDEPEPPLAA